MGVYTYNEKNVYIMRSTQQANWLG